MSYLDPLSINYVGDKVVAMRHVRDARRFVYLLLRELGDAGLSVGRRRHVLKNGVEIFVQVAGLQAFAEIDVRGFKSQAVEVADQFVLIARTVELPNGIDPDHPEQMVTPPPDGWITLFYDELVPGFDEFAGDKGTYAFEGDIEVFPDGVRHYGNIDWTAGFEDNRRISWYGPQTRCFYEPYKQPTKVYGKFVFALGQVMLDVDKYIEDSAELSPPQPPFDARWVLGACLRDDGTTLVVMHAVFTDQPSPTDSVGSETTVVSKPYPTGSIQLELASYDLVPDPESDSPVALIAAPGSRQVLLSFMMNEAVNPWFFNQSGTVGVTCTPPANPEVRLSVPVASVDPLTMTTPPSTTSQRGVVSFDNNSWSVDLETLTMGVAPSDQVVCTDFVNDEPRHLRIARRPAPDKGSFAAIDAPGDEFFLVTTDGLLPLHKNIFEAPNPDNGNRPSWNVEHRALMYADPRDAILVTTRYVRKLRLNTFPLDIEPGSALEIWVDSEFRYSRQLATDKLTAHGLLREAGGRYYDLGWGVLNLHAVAPQWPLYGYFIQVQEGPPAKRLLQVDYYGKHAHYDMLYSQQDEVFGTLRFNYPSQVNQLIRYDLTTELTEERFDVDAEDVHGYHSAVGCATTDGGGYVFLSCWAYYDFDGSGRGEAEVALVDVGIGPPELTGVTGEKQRYHPIWRLGTLPRLTI